MLEILRFFRNYGHYRNFKYNVEYISSFLAHWEKDRGSAHRCKNTVSYTAI